jgi:hypothetical protein
MPSYPVCEKHRFVRIGVGDTDWVRWILIRQICHWRLIFGNALPRAESLTADICESHVNYRALMDKLIELTRKTCVHADSLFQQELFDTAMLTESSGNSVTVS